MSFAGATNDLPAEGSGADFSTNVGDRTGQAQLPFTEGLAATASGAFLGATHALGNYLDIDQQASRARLDQQFNVDPTADPGGALIDPKEWQTKYPDMGLTFTPDMGVAQAQMLVDHKSDELRRQFVIDHSPNTLLAKTTRGLTDFAVSALDPLNIAATLVPGVGETRAGLWAAKLGLGKTAARLIEGGTAGAGGMAALTPLDAAEAHAYQDHYGPLDAFANVAFGTVLGGGLHAGFGALSDFLSRAAPETREAAMRAAVAQAAEGRSVDVEPVLASDPGLSPEPMAQPAPEPTAPTQQDISSALDDVKASRAAAPNESSLFNEIRGLGGIKTKDGSGKPMTGAPEIQQIMDTNRSLFNNKTGRPPDMIREALKERGWFGPREDSGADLQDLHDLIEQEARGSKVYHPDSGIHEDLAYRQLLDREVTEAGVVSTDKPDVAARKLAEYRASRRASDLADLHEQSAGQDLTGLSNEGQEEVQSHGYEPGADFGAEFEDQAGGAGQGAGGREAFGGGPGQGGPDAGEAIRRGEIQAKARQSIERARQNSIAAARGQEPSALTVTPETAAHADAIIKAGDDPKAELADAEAQLRGYKAQGIISDEEHTAFSEANAAADEAAKARTDAASAAARCLFLHP